MANKKKVHGTLIYDSWLLTFSVMSDEAAGLLIKAIAAHVLGSELELPENMRLSAAKMFEQIDADRKHYDDKCLKLAENRTKGFQKKSNEEQLISNDEQMKGNSNSNSKSNSNSIVSNETIKEILSKESTKKAAPRFLPPSVEEVRAYCQERKNSVDPEGFVNFYSSKGWKIGNQNMKDWKAAVRTWEKRENFTSSPKRGTKTGSDAGITYLGTSDRGVSVSGTSGENTATGKHEDIFDLFG